jgi:hypothetical protein
MENYINKYEKIMQIRLNEFKKSEKKENDIFRKCSSESNVYKEKELEIINLKKNSLQRKNFIKKYIMNLYKIKEKNKFLLEFFTKKQILFKFVQKKYFLNYYLTIPFKEKLIEFIKFYTSELLFSKKKFYEKEKIFEFILNFISNKNFKNFNDEINLIDMESHKIFKKILKEKNSSNHKYIKKGLLFEDFKKKCLIFDFEKYKEFFVVNNFSVNKIISENFPNLKKLNLCSREIILIKFFTFRIFLKIFKKKFSVENLEILFEKIIKFLNKMKKDLEKQIININENFVIFNEKFSGKFDYFNNQINLYREKEKKFNEEIYNFQEKLIFLENFDKSENEIKLFDNLLNTKKRYCKFIRKYMNL